MFFFFSLLPLSIRNDLNSILEPLDLGIILLNANIKYGGVVLHNLLTLQLAGELVLKLGNLDITLGLILSLLAKLLDDALVLARVLNLGAPDVQGAHTLLALDTESKHNYFNIF